MSEPIWIRCDNSAQGAYWVHIMRSSNYVVFVLDPSHKVLVASVLALKQGSAGLDVSDKRIWPLLTASLSTELEVVMKDFVARVAEGSLPCS